MIPITPALPGTDHLLTKLRAVCFPWRRLTIAVDGRNGAGKSSLARHLSWQLGMPALETYLWMSDRLPLRHRTTELARVIRSRHRHNRPVIVEGVLLLRTLEQVGVEPDYLILVTNLAREPDPEDDGTDQQPCLSADVDAYIKEYRPLERADFHLTWDEDRAYAGS